MNTCFKII